MLIYILESGEMLILYFTSCDIMEAYFWSFEAFEVITRARCYKDES